MHELHMPILISSHLSSGHFHHGLSIIPNCAIQSNNSDFEID